MKKSQATDTDNTQLKAEDLRQLLSLMHKERRERRWNLGFRITKYLIVIGVLVAVFMSFSRVSPPVSVPIGIGGGGDPHVAKVRLEGVIAFNTLASSDTMNESLRAAFESANTAAVMIEIDSPGSPVHAGEIYDEIMRLREMYPDIPTISLIRDLGASGAYYVAAATESIYANRASLVGSIGVVSGGFGFQEMIEKIGVERRLYTAGEYKVSWILLPEEDSEREAWEEVLISVQKQFISRVKKAREGLITDQRAYTGLLWSGEQAKEIGLVDHVGDISAILDELDVENVVDFTSKPPYLESFFESFSRVMAKSFADFRLQLRPASQ